MKPISPWALLRRPARGCTAAAPVGLLMKPAKLLPCALTIAGSDSGGGAGIQADLKTFASLGVHGACAVTCITAQNPKGVRGIQSCKPAIVAAQIEAVVQELRPAAVKTGMLYSAEIIRTVVETLTPFRVTNLVVDPVMIATSGAQLLKPSAVRLLKSELLPKAVLMTPNLQEAEVLSGKRITIPEDLRHVARHLHASFGCAVLVKGGHLRGIREALDVFYDGSTELLLRAPFIRGISTHGTGCTYSAAITACLATGMPLAKAVTKSKEYITQAIAQSCAVGRHTILNSFWRR